MSSNDSRSALNLHDLVRSDTAGSAEPATVRPVVPHELLLEVEARLRLAGHTTGVWYDRRLALLHTEQLLAALDVAHLSLADADRDARALAAPPQVPVKECCGAVLVGEECDCLTFAAGDGR